MSLSSGERKIPTYATDDVHAIVTTADGEVVENSDALHRRLDNRQIQLIAIGGSIGTAIFVSIGMIYENSDNQFDSNTFSQHTC